MTSEGGAMSVKSDRANASGVVRRAFPVQLEVRAKPGAAAVSTVEGYASVTESPFEMWDWLGMYHEVVRAGAFGKTLGENPQVQLLLNHGGLAMAYTKAGTLRLAEDSTGLHMEADVSTKRSDVSDMLAALDDGSVDEMSFAFRVTRQLWSPDYDQRDIIEVDLHRGDVSVVNFGANPATSVGAMRSADFDQMDEVDARALYERLQRRLEPTPEAVAHPLDLYRMQAEALSL
ncbi:HK97 family phage prohead protease [Streptomyces microflavus]|uniref:HK97 family phage prohead protease n=1 Tax=Streptomyces microflavus TaxID=1919 RepID=UPI00332DF98A